MNSASRRLAYTPIRSLAIQYVLSDLRLQGVLTGLREGEMERDLLLTELEYVSEVLTILTTMAE
jgi:hypothetical protein